MKAKIRCTKCKRCIQRLQTLVEHISISSNNTKSKTSKQDKLVEEYKTKDKGILRLFPYKILVETFNKKYTNLNDEQKSLLREYINNISNTTKFNEYFESELIKTITTLHEMYKGMKDKITNQVERNYKCFKVKKLVKRLPAEKVSDDYVL